MNSEQKNLYKIIKYQMITKKLNNIISLLFASNTCKKQIYLIFYFLQEILIKSKHELICLFFVRNIT